MKTTELSPCFSTLRIFTALFSVRSWNRSKLTSTDIDSPRADSFWREISHIITSRRSEGLRSISCRLNYTPNTYTYTSYCCKPGRVKSFDCSGRHNLPISTHIASRALICIGFSMTGQPILPYVIQYSETRGLFTALVPLHTYTRLKKRTNFWCVEVIMGPRKHI